MHEEHVDFRGLSEGRQHLADELGPQIYSPLLVFALCLRVFRKLHVLLEREVLCEDSYQDDISMPTFCMLS